MYNFYQKKKSISNEFHEQKKKSPCGKLDEQKSARNKSHKQNRFQEKKNQCTNFARRRIDMPQDSKTKLRHNKYNQQNQHTRSPMNKISLMRKKKSMWQFHEEKKSKRNKCNERKTAQNNFHEKKSACKKFHEQNQFN